MFGIMDQDVVGLGDPVGFGQSLAERLERGFVHMERLAQRFLFGGHPLAAPLLLMTQPQQFLGRVIQIAQQLPLPAVPHARPHRANVHHGQAQEQPQPFGALHHVNKVHDRLVIGQIALERRC